MARQILRMIRGVFASLFFWLLCYLPVAADDSYLIERDTRGRFLVSTHINNVGPFPFLLDSGAERSVINHHLVHALDLEPHPTKTQTIYTATGRRELGLYPIKLLEALGRTLKPEFMASTGLNGPMGQDMQHFGILGLDLMRRHIVHISRTQGVALHPTAQPFLKEGWLEIPGRPAGRGVIAVTLPVAQSNIAMLVDTGAERTVFNRAAMAVIGERWELDAGTPVGVASAGGNMQATRYRLKESAAMPTLLGEPLHSILVADLPIFRQLGASETAAGILGVDRLASQDIALDFKDWRLFLRENSQEKPPSKE